MYDFALLRGNRDVDDGVGRPVDDGMPGECNCSAMWKHVLRWATADEAESRVREGNGLHRGVRGVICDGKTWLFRR